MSITAERRIREKEAMRTNILTTAWHIVKEEGWQSLSIRKIADAIQYSVPVIYDYFENKEAILLEFGKQGFERVIAELKAAKASSSDPAEQLKAIADAYWAFAFANKEYYQLMWGMSAPSCEMDKCMPERSVFRDLVMASIIEIIEKANPGDAENNACLKYHTFWSILHGLISIKMVAPADDTEQLNKLVLDDAITGFIKNLKS
ncbi:TetR family transcriptional regulator [Parapedobacter defluvii]|uniref:TetR family transcriptional regulator n=1 Tax=Parapedobacter defluvii TaxID=2045106 RepID=A0ABQ1MMF8_9SPHI|nr:TetR/AcrR family transcriptional regulator [Parapedobacter defluvii]GGC43358.1 TetR family transcriptional regulator [Parapedobacter defluvii]